MSYFFPHPVYTYERQGAKGIGDVILGIPRVGVRPSAMGQVVSGEPRSAGTRRRNGRQGTAIVRCGSDRELFLRRSEDIDRAKRVGRRVPSPQFNMVVAPVESGRLKLAVVVGRKFGPATMRNRAKRRIRELARAVEARLTPHYHVVIFPKSPVLKMQFSELAMVWHSILRREGLLRE